MIALRAHLFVGLLAGCFVGTFAVGLASGKEPVQPDLSKYASGFARWEPAITKFESLDRDLPAQPDSVLLIGSSSIRLWESAADDLAPYPIIRRGYGGAQFSDVAHFAKRLITPHQFQAVVVFVGNDVTGGPHDKTPDEVGRLFGYLAEVITHHQPDAEIICCDVRPTPSRFRAWENIQAANAALKAECDKRPNVHYLNTTPEFLTADGSAPRPELHRKDQLHLNADGYAIWSRQIKAELNRVLKD